MQIRMEKFEKFYIEHAKITGIICNDINYLDNINDMIYNGNNNVQYSLKYKSKNIGLISLKETYSVSTKYVKDYIPKTKKDLKEIFKLLGINNDILERKISTLSTSEKILVTFAKVLMCDPDTILVNNILSKLDMKFRDKIIKMLLKLKKFENKTIVVSSTDVDIIFDFIDNIIIFEDDRCISSINKYDTYKESEIIDKPLVVEIANRVYNKNKIKLGNNDSINELIKAIYREIR